MKLINETYHSAEAYTRLYETRDIAELAEYIRRNCGYIHSMTVNMNLASLGSEVFQIEEYHNLIRPVITIRTKLTSVKPEEVIRHGSIAS